MKRKHIIELLEGYHKITPIKAINQYNSRFAYKIIGRRGLWELVGANAVTGKFKYKKWD